MSRELAGATVNAVGTKIATAKALGTNKLDTASASNDANQAILLGSMTVPVAKAINMGILQRNAAGALEELNPPATPTRVG